MVEITAGVHGSSLAHRTNVLRDDGRVAPHSEATTNRLVGLGVVLAVVVVQATWFATLALVLLRLAH